MADDNLNGKNNSEKIKDVEKKFILLEAHKRILLRTMLLFWLVGMVFLFLRTLLELLGADPKSFFAGFVYAISSFFLLPFFGIFPHFNNTIQPGKMIFDAPALVAMVCYTIIVILAALVIYILTRIAKTERQVNETIINEKIPKTTEAESKIV